MLNVVTLSCSQERRQWASREYKHNARSVFFYSITSNNDNLLLHCFVHLSQILSEFISKPSTEFKHT